MIKYIQIVADSNWIAINNPITEEIISGLKPYYIIKNHNNIKKKLLSYIEPNNEIKSAVYFGYDRVDILNMINDNFKRIIFIENDLEKQELIRKLATRIEYKIYNDILDYEEQEKVDAIIMINKISTFFNNNESIQKISWFIKTSLKKGGKIIILTLDGYKVKKLFENNDYFDEIQDNVDNYKKAKLTQFNLRLYGNKILNNLQEEYLTNLKGLTDYFEQINIKLVAADNTTKEKLLNSEEFVYNQLFTWIIYRSE